MKNFDIITVGNAIIDIFLTFHDGNSACRLDEKTKELCFGYGQKVKVDHAELLTGGNANNVAIGLARLGFAATIAAEIGDDEFAQKIVNNLKQHHVDESLVKQTQGAKSSFAVGLNVKGERTLFVEHMSRAHEFTFGNVNSKWMYLTSLGNEWRHAYRTALEFAQKNNIQLAFNPGTYQLTLLGGDLYHILSKTNILFVNREEGEKISNLQFSISNEYREEMKKLLKMLRNYTPGAIVVTDGMNGSYSVDKNGTMRLIGLFDTDVVERTGAGDAYATGFLGAIMSRLSIEEAMRWGSVNAASVVTKVGAQAGLMTKEAIEQKLKDQEDFQARELQ